MTLLTPDAGRAYGALLGVAEKVSDSGSWAWYVQTGELVWSDNMFRILDLKPGRDAPDASSIPERAHPDDRERVSVVLERARAGTPVASFTYRTLTRSGATRVMTASLALQLSRRDGDVLVGLLRDTTRSSRTERELAARIAVSDALSMWDSFERDAERLLCALATSLGFSCAVLWIRTGDELVPRALWDENERLRPAAGADPLRFRPHVGLAGRAWGQRGLVVAQDLRRASDHRLRAVALERGLRGGVAVPIPSPAGVTLAVLTLAGRDVLEDDGRGWGTLDGIAHEIGTFLAGRWAEVTGSVLSAREVEVLQLAAEGVSGPEIAARLHLSPSTVNTHFRNIYSKYRVPDRVAAVARALREGVIR